MFVTLADLRAAGLGQTTEPATTTTATAQAAPLAPVIPAGTLVQQAVDDVLRPAGLPTDVPGVYTLDRLYSIQNAAVAKGVDSGQVVALVRQEVFRRVLRPDPNPQGDLTELALRLTGTTAYAPQPAPPAAPVPVYAPQPVPAPVQAPAFAEPQPMRGARRRFDPPRSSRGSTPAWVPIAAAAVGGALLVALVVRK